MRVCVCVRACLEGRHCHPDVWAGEGVLVGKTSLSARGGPPLPEARQPSVGGGCVIVGLFVCVICLCFLVGLVSLLVGELVAMVAFLSGLVGGCVLLFAMASARAGQCCARGTGVYPQGPGRMHPNSSETQRNGSLPPQTPQTLGLIPTKRVSLVDYPKIGLNPVPNLGVMNYPWV